MFNKNSTLRRWITTFAIVLVFAIGVLAPKKASADQSMVCAPNLIEYLENQLIMQCNSINYYGQSATRTSGCPVVAVDTLKFWQTLTDSALLAGKSVRIYFNTCAGFNFATAVDLIK